MLITTLSSAALPDMTIAMLANEESPEPVNGRANHLNKQEDTFPNHQQQASDTSYHSDANDRNICGSVNICERKKHVSFHMTDVSWPWLLVMICISFSYLTLGGAVIYVIEGDAAQYNITTEQLQPYTRNFLNAHPDINASELFLLIEIIAVALDNGSLTMPNRGPPWTFDTAVFFACTVVTTIGFGNMAPVTGEGQVFIVVFALIGIPLNLVVVASLGSKLNIAFRHLVVRLFTACGHPHVSSRYKKIVAQLFVSLTGLVFLVIIPTFIFVNLEGWSYSQAIYFSVITLTTIGFGDLVSGFTRTMDEEWLIIYRVCLTLWLMLGLTWLSTMFNSQKELCTFCFHMSVEKQRRWSQRIRSAQKEPKTEVSPTATLPAQTPFTRKRLINVASTSRVNILQVGENGEDEEEEEEACRAEEEPKEMEKKVNINLNGAVTSYNKDGAVTGYVNEAAEIVEEDAQPRTLETLEAGMN